MPLLPKFEISQDEEYVYIRIYVPHIKVSSAEMIADGCDFSFYCKPYLLKLTFPHSLDGDDEERCKATYDPLVNHGVIIGHLPKSVKGQYFEDLDLKTTLLQKRMIKDEIPGINIPLIEVLNSSDVQEDDNITNSSSSSTNEENRGRERSEMYENRKTIQILSSKYGFNQNYSNILGAFTEDSILELKENPDTLPESYRRRLRIESENQIFSAERYLGDYFQGESDHLYQQAMKYETFWNIAWIHRRSSFSSETMEISRLEFTEAEQAVMVSLPNKEYLISNGSKEESRVLMGMIDILFAYCYDYRFNCGENTVESPETITRLSCHLSWLDSFESPEDSYLDLIKTMARRSVIYPYFRMWKYTRRILADVAKILYLGKRYVLKCFLHLYSIFEHTEQYYILNKLYISDYCVWIQSCLTEEGLLNTANLFNEAKRKLESSSCEGKEIMGFHLPDLESWATEYIQRIQLDISSTSNSSSNSGSEVHMLGLESFPDIPSEFLIYSNPYDDDH